MFKRIMSSLRNKKPTRAVKDNSNINTPFSGKAATEAVSGYIVVNSDDANYSNIKRKNFRVIVPLGVTDRELLDMFKEIDRRDCDEVTVWCFHSRHEIDQYKPYTVAMLERINKKTAIRITRR